MKNKLLIAILIILNLAVTVQAQEIGYDDEVYSSPIRPQTPLQNEVTTPAVRPLNPVSPLQNWSAAEIAEFQRLSCPGSTSCHGPFRSSAQDGSYFDSLCQEFIKSNGELGETGQLMLLAMQEVEDANRNNNTRNCSFQNSFDFGATCPNYKYMSEEQKKHVWVWLWASVAQSKSSCDPAKDAQGIFDDTLGRNRLEDGLFGLEYSADTRRVSGRDPRFCPLSPETDSKTLTFQSRCAASIMYENQCNKGVVNPESHWAGLQTSQSDIAQRVQRHPLCR